MDEYNFLTIGILYLSGIMFPGPSIFLVLKNSTALSRMHGIYSALGIILGIAIQSLSILLGLYFLDAEDLIFKILQILSSLFLLFLGLKNLYGNKLSNVNSKLTNSKLLTFFEAFILEILNPLALVFFIGIFSSLVIGANIYIKFLYWVEIVVLGCIWFCGVTLISSSDKFSFYLKNFKRKIEIISGIIFVMFSIDNIYNTFILF